MNEQTAICDACGRTVAVLRLRLGLHWVGDDPCPASGHRVDEASVPGRGQAVLYDRDDQTAVVVTVFPSDDWARGVTA